MSAHQIIIWIMAGFALLGAADKILGNKLGMGKGFEEGILTMGPLMLTMAGIITLTPLLAGLLRPVIVPVFTWLGADPAMFAGALLACDMGAGPLAQELSKDPQAILLGGVLTGSMMGVTVVFTIPAAMGILQPEDRPAMAKGILCGVMTVPVGILAAGLTAGFPLLMVLKNLIPIALLAALIALGVWKVEKWIVKGLVIFGKGVLALTCLGLALAILESLTGIAVIPGLAPIEDAILTVGAIAIVLAGAFPLASVVTRLLKKPLEKLGKLLGMGSAATGGLITTLVNSIATFHLIKDMDERGKVVNLAFAVSAAFVFGDHLGFTADFAPEMLPGLIVGKLTGGICAVAVALLLTRRKVKK